MHTLLMWGFPRKCPPNHSGGGYADMAVAASARKLLGRGDAHGLALSGERICQIYAKCMPEIRARERDCIWKSPSRYLVDGRRQSMPIASRGKSLAELADLLIRNEGEWVEPEPEGSDLIFHHDLPLTAAEHRKWLATPRLRLKSG
ncbi:MULTISPECIES: hypothetical protein [unclassified Methylibium]|uniref:hypothetical protein n=1 Tax=unclassified Methylibium TaxID=2633235 RepID=UPI0003F3E2FC|nr:MULTISPECIES: hypothetical protein [unclassified Methylibium]EWS53406.1 hypothetical protein X551_03807 [Methylibium sp. T29]EWS58580.1 hypothetical protein Y694_03547 [Methylibium sp. T29-B]